MRNIAGMVLFAAMAGLAFGQSIPSTTPPAGAATGAAPAVASTPAKFEIADIHTSPRHRYPYFEGGFLENGRYILRQATMADLITTAYGLKNSSYVQGGPSWLEWDRWDIIAKVPAGTTDASAKDMLKSLLEERFKLMAHKGDALVPAYWLTVVPGGLKLKAAADTSVDGQCHGSPMTGTEPGGVPLTVLSCKNKSMAALAETLTNNRGGMYLQSPVVDKTDLKGAYDFDLKFTPMYMLSHAGGAGVTIFSAVENDLGLKLELKTAPQPGVVVESLEQTPTPNSPDLAKVMTPLPPAQFEVATIKPSAPDEKPSGRFAGNEINVHALPLRFLITFAWDLDANDKGEIVGAPKSIDSDKIDVEAKVEANAAPQAGGPAGRPPIPIEELQAMLRALLIERYEMKVHMEDQPADAYDLVAVKPKLIPADPKTRTNCHPGPGPDGKDPRLDHPILNMLVTCQNVTMAQAAADFPHFAAYYLYYPAVDKTDLKGGWDFTMSWSSGDLMPDFSHSSSPQVSDTASEPNGALSFPDALNKELGLKLVKVKRPEPVLVIDHIDDQPTPN